jgi:hypothetical protein
MPKPLILMMLSAVFRYFPKPELITAQIQHLPSTAAFLDTPKLCVLQVISHN